MTSEECKFRVVNSLISQLGNDGFRFADKDRVNPGDRKYNVGENIVAGVVTNAIYGIVFGPFSWSNSSSEDTLYKDLKSLSECGVIAGYKKHLGGSYLSAILDTSNLSDESIVGRLAIIYEHLIPFQKYSVGLNTIFSDGRFVECKTYLLFTEKYRSDHFILNLSKQCKYKKGLRCVYNHPVVIDFNGKKVFEKHKLFEKYSESNLNLMF
jgi:hypothetical protein